MILQILLNSDFRQAHDGMALAAKKEGIDVAAIKPGSYVIFINTARDRVKLFASDNTIAYKRLKSGTLDLRAIQHIPACFNGKDLDLNKAQLKFLESKLGTTASKS